MPVWIAQREGRAKDGIDRTEPAVIKMLSLSRDKQTEEFAAHIAGLRIVPVSISYEIDPCDGMKAHEMRVRRETGAYEKAAQEDVTSIGRGIAGGKGRVHVHFGAPLSGDLPDPAAVAKVLDEEIVRGYRLHPTNVMAHRRLHGDRDLAMLDVAEGSCSQTAFDARIEALPDADRADALAAYANAVDAKLRLPEYQ